MSSNLPDGGTKCFVRESSEPKDAANLITEFIDHLWELESKFYELIPNEINDAITKIEKRIISSRFSKLQTREKNILAYLKKFKELPCYGFNSGKKLHNINSFNIFI